MNNRQKKRRFSALITEPTYNKVFDFVKNNELVTGKLVPGTVLELALLVFFEEVTKRPLEEIAIEYLSNDRVDGGA